MKPVLTHVNSSTCINSGKEVNNLNSNNGSKDSKFKFGDIIRIWKYKNIFAKGYVPNWSQEVFIIKKVKDTVLWTMLLVQRNC